MNSTDRNYMVLTRCVVTIALQLRQQKIKELNHLSQ